MQKNKKCGDRTIWFSVDELTSRITINRGLRVAACSVERESTFYMKFYFSIFYSRFFTNFDYFHNLKNKISSVTTNIINEKNATPIHVTLMHTINYYAHDGPTRPRGEGGNKRCLSVRPSVCPSVAYVANNLRTQRSSVPKFGRTVTDLGATHTPVSKSNGQRSGSPGPLMLTHVMCHIFRMAWHTKRTSDLVYGWKTTTHISHRRHDLQGQR